jgi:hypothetical protein
VRVGLAGSIAAAMLCAGLTPNLGRLPGEKGVWNVPWIRNMGLRMAWNLAWRPDGELAEYICQENNQYLLRLTDDFGQPICGRKP